MASDVPGQEPASIGADRAGVALIDPVQAVPVPPEELNAWRRGFTPQAEIWNGRLAMLGLSVGIAVLVLSRLFT